MSEQPTTAAGRALLEWVAFVEKVDDPAGNTIYDEIRRNFLLAIEAEARQQDGSARCGCQCHGPYVWDVCPHCRPDLLAALPPSAPPALDGVTAELVGIEAALDDAMKRLHRTTDTLARLQEQDR